MNRPRIRTSVRHSVIAALAVTPILLTATITSRAAATPSTSATAGAWTNQQTQSGIASANESVSYQGGGGSAAGSAGAGVGTTAGSASMLGCAIDLPPDGQVCNNAIGQSSFDDQVTVLSDAPDGTPITVRVTFQCAGHLDGMGAYTYSSSCAVFNTGVSGANGSSGGVITTASNVPISSSGSVDFGWITGSAFGVGASSSVSVSNRCCFGGAEQSWSMTLTLGTVVTISAPTLPAGATYVHFTGSDGHDYATGTTSVGSALSVREGLSAPSPNPTIGSSRLDLTLIRARYVDVGVFDVSGRRVATIARGVIEPGTRPIVWDGRDDRGAITHSGVYLVRARGEGLNATRRILKLQ